MQQHIHEYNMVTYGWCTVTSEFGADKQFLVSRFSGWVERSLGQLSMELDINIAGFC